MNRPLAPRHTFGTCAAAVALVVCGAVDARAATFTEQRHGAGLRYGVPLGGTDRGLVAWTTADAGSAPEVRFATFDRARARFRRSRRLAVARHGRLRAPVMDVDRRGAATIAWVRRPTRSRSQLEVVRVSPRGRVSRVAVLARTRRGFIATPQVAVDDRGGAVLAWSVNVSGFHRGVRARVAEGRTWRPTRTLHPPRRDSSRLRVAASSDGRYVVLWHPFSGGLQSAPPTAASSALGNSGRFSAPAPIPTTDKATECGSPTFGAGGELLVSCAQAPDIIKGSVRVLQISRGGTVNDLLRVPARQGVTEPQPLAVSPAGHAAITVPREANALHPGFELMTRRPGQAFGPARRVTSAFFNAVRPAVDDMGSTAVAWTVDRDDDGSNVHGLVHVATGRVGGALGRPHRISGRSAALENLAFIGGRPVVAVHRQPGHELWTAVGRARRSGGHSARMAVNPSRAELGRRPGASREPRGRNPSVAHTWSAHARMDAASARRIAADPAAPTASRCRLTASRTAQRSKRYLRDGSEDALADLALAVTALLGELLWDEAGPRAPMVAMLPDPRVEVTSPTKVRLHADVAEVGPDHDDEVTRAVCGALARPPARSVRGLGEATSEAP